MASGGPGTTVGRSNFSIPKIKKTTFKDNLQLVSTSNRDIQNLLQDINKNCLDINFIKNVNVVQVHIVHNELLQSRYMKKRAELKDDGRTSQSLTDQFGFLHCKDEDRFRIAKEGIKTEKQPYRRLGDGKYGIYVNRFFDVEVKQAWVTLTEMGQANIFVFKYFPGKCKAISTGNIHSKPEALEPTPNYDSHVSSTPPQLTGSLYTQQARASIYLYEYTEDCFPSEWPRQCLPFAVIRVQKKKHPEKPLKQSKPSIENPSVTVTEKTVAANVTIVANVTAAANVKCNPPVPVNKPPSGPLLPTPSYSPSFKESKIMSAVKDTSLLGIAKAPKVHNDVFAESHASHEDPKKKVLADVQKMLTFQRQKNSMVEELCKDKNQGSGLSYERSWRQPLLGAKPNFQTSMAGHFRGTNDSVLKVTDFKKSGAGTCNNLSTQNSVTDRTESRKKDPRLMRSVSAYSQQRITDSLDKKIDPRLQKRCHSLTDEMNHSKTADSKKENATTTDRVGDTRRSVGDPSQLIMKDCGHSKLKEKKKMSYADYKKLKSNGERVSLGTSTEKSTDNTDKGNNNQNHPQTSDNAIAKEPQNIKGAETLAKNLQSPLPSEKFDKKVSSREAGTSSGSKQPSKHIQLSVHKHDKLEHFQSPINTVIPQDPWSAFRTKNVPSSSFSLNANKASAEKYVSDASRKISSAALGKNLLVALQLSSDIQKNPTSQNDTASKTSFVKSKPSKKGLLPIPKESVNGAVKEVRVSSQDDKKTQYNKMKISDALFEQDSLKSSGTEAYCTTETTFLSPSSLSQKQTKTDNKVQDEENRKPSEDGQKKNEKESFSPALVKALSKNLIQKIAKGSSTLTQSASKQTETETPIKGHRGENGERPAGCDVNEIMENIPQKNSVPAEEYISGQDFPSEEAVNQVVKVFNKKLSANFKKLRKSENNESGSMSQGNCPGGEVTTEPRVGNCLNTNAQVAGLIGDELSDRHKRSDAGLSANHSKSTGSSESPYPPLKLILSLVSDDTDQTDNVKAKPSAQNCKEDQHVSETSSLEKSDDTIQYPVSHFESQSSSSPSVLNVDSHATSCSILLLSSEKPQCQQKQIIHSARINPYTNGVKQDDLNTPEATPIISRHLETTKLNENKIIDQMSEESISNKPDGALKNAKNIHQPSERTFYLNNEQVLVTADQVEQLASEEIKPLPRSVSMRELGLESYLLALSDFKYQPNTVLVDFQVAKRDCYHALDCKVCKDQLSAAFEYGESSSKHQHNSQHVVSAEQRSQHSANQISESASPSMKPNEDVVSSIISEQDDGHGTQEKCAAHNSLNDTKPDCSAKENLETVPDTGLKVVGAQTDQTSKNLECSQDIEEICQNHPLESHHNSLSKLKDERSYNSVVKALKDRSKGESKDEEELDSIRERNSLGVAVPGSLKKKTPVPGKLVKPSVFNDLPSTKMRTDFSDDVSVKDDSSDTSVALVIDESHSDTSLKSVNGTQVDELKVPCQGKPSLEVPVKVEQVSRSSVAFDSQEKILCLSSQKTCLMPETVGSPHSKDTVFAEREQKLSKPAMSKSEQPAPSKYVIDAHAVTNSSKVEPVCVAKNTTESESSVGTICNEHLQNQTISRSLRTAQGSEIPKTVKATKLKSCKQGDLKENSSSSSTSKSSTGVACNPKKLSKLCPTLKPVANMKQTNSRLMAMQHKRDKGVKSESKSPKGSSDKSKWSKIQHPKLDKLTAGKRSKDMIDIRGAIERQGSTASRERNQSSKIKSLKEINFHSSGKTGDKVSTESDSYHRVSSLSASASLSSTSLSSSASHSAVKPGKETSLYEVANALINGETTTKTDRFQNGISSSPTLLPVTPELRTDEKLRKDISLITRQADDTSDVAGSSKNVSESLSKKGEETVQSSTTPLNENMKNNEVAQPNLKINPEMNSPWSSEPFMDKGQRSLSMVPRRFMRPKSMSQSKTGTSQAAALTIPVSDTTRFHSIINQTDIIQAMEGQKVGSNDRKKPDSKTTAAQLVLKENKNKPSVASQKKQIAECQNEVSDILVAFTSKSLQSIAGKSKSSTVTISEKKYGENANAHHAVQDGTRKEQVESRQSDLQKCQGDELMSCEKENETFTASKETCGNSEPHTNSKDLDLKTKSPTSSGKENVTCRQPGNSSETYGNGLSTTKPQKSWIPIPLLGENISSEHQNTGGGENVVNATKAEVSKKCAETRFSHSATNQLEVPAMDSHKSPLAVHEIDTGSSSSKNKYETIQVSVPTHCVTSPSSGLYSPSNPTSPCTLSTSKDSVTSLAVYIKRNGNDNSRQDGSTPFTPYVDSHGDVDYRVSVTQQILPAIQQPLQNSNKTFPHVGPAAVQHCGRTDPQLNQQVRKPSQNFLLHQPKTFNYQQPSLTWRRGVHPQITQRTEMYPQNTHFESSAVRDSRDHDYRSLPGSPQAFQSSPRPSLGFRPSVAFNSNNFVTQGRSFNWTSSSSNLNQNTLQSPNCVAKKTPFSWSTIDSHMKQYRTTPEAPIEEYTTSIACAAEGSTPLRVPNTNSNRVNIPGLDFSSSTARHNSGPETGISSAENPSSGTPVCGSETTVSKAGGDTENQLSFFDPKVLLPEIFSPPKPQEAHVRKCRSLLDAVVEEKSNKTPLESETKNVHILFQNVKNALEYLKVKAEGSKMKGAVPMENKTPNSNGALCQNRISSESNLHTQSTDISGCLSDSVCTGQSKSLDSGNKTSSLENVEQDNSASKENTDVNQLFQSLSSTIQTAMSASKQKQQTQSSLEAHSFMEKILQRRQQQVNKTASRGTELNRVKGADHETKGVGASLLSEIDKSQHQLHNSQEGSEKSIANRLSLTAQTSEKSALESLEICPPNLRQSQQNSRMLKDKVASYSEEHQTSGSRMRIKQTFDSLSASKSTAQTTGITITTIKRQSIKRISRREDILYSSRSTSRERKKSLARSRAGSASSRGHSSRSRSSSISGSRTPPRRRYKKSRSRSSSRERMLNGKVSNLDHELSQKNKNSDPYYWFRDKFTSGSAHHKSSSRSHSHSPVYHSRGSASPKGRRGRRSDSLRGRSSSSDSTSAERKHRKTSVSRSRSHGRRSYSHFRRRSDSSESTDAERKHKKRYTRRSRSRGRSSSHFRRRSSNSESTDFERKHKKRYDSHSRSRRRSYSHSRSDSSESTSAERKYRKKSPTRRHGRRYDSLSGRSESSESRSADRKHKKRSGSPRRSYERSWSHHRRSFSSESKASGRECRKRSVSPGRICEKRLKNVRRSDSIDSFISDPQHDGSSVGPRRFDRPSSPSQRLNFTPNKDLGAYRRNSSSSETVTESRVSTVKKNPPMVEGRSSFQRVPGQQDSPAILANGHLSATQSTSGVGTQSPSTSSSRILLSDVPMDALTYARDKILGEIYNLTENDTEGVDSNQDISCDTSVNGMSQNLVSPHKKIVQKHSSSRHETLTAADEETKEPRTSYRFSSKFNNKSPILISDSELTDDNFSPRNGEKQKVQPVTAASKKTCKILTDIPQDRSVNKTHISGSEANVQDPYVRRSEPKQKEVIVIDTDSEDDHPLYWTEEKKQKYYSKAGRQGNVDKKNARSEDEPQNISSSTSEVPSTKHVGKPDSDTDTNQTNSDVYPSDSCVGKELTVQDSKVKKTSKRQILHGEDSPSQMEDITTPPSSGQKMSNVQKSTPAEMSESSGSGGIKYAFHNADMSIKIANRQDSENDNEIDDEDKDEIQPIRIIWLKEKTSDKPPSSSQGRPETEDTAKGSTKSKSLTNISETNPNNDFGLKVRQHSTDIEREKADLMISIETDISSALHNSRQWSKMERKREREESSERTDMIKKAKLCSQADEDVDEGTRCVKNIEEMSLCTRNEQANGDDTISKDSSVDVDLKTLQKSIENKDKTLDISENLSCTSEAVQSNNESKTNESSFDEDSIKDKNCSSPHSGSYCKDRKRDRSLSADKRKKVRRRDGEKTNRHSRGKWRHARSKTRSPLRSGSRRSRSRSYHSPSRHRDTHFSRYHRSSTSRSPASYDWGRRRTRSKSPPLQQRSSASPSPHRQRRYQSSNSPSRRRRSPVLPRHSPQYHYHFSPHRRPSPVFRGSSPQYRDRFSPYRKRSPVLGSYSPQFRDHLPHRPPRQSSIHKNSHRYDTFSPRYLDRLVSPPRICSRFRSISPVRSPSRYECTRKKRGEDPEYYPSPENDSHDASLMKTGQVQNQHPLDILSNLSHQKKDSTVNDLDYYTSRSSKYEVKTRTVIIKNAVVYPSELPSPNGEVKSDSSRRDDVISDSSRNDGGISDSSRKGEGISDSPRKGEILSDPSRKSKVASDSSRKCEVVSDSSRTCEIVSDSSQKGKIISDSCRKIEVVSGSSRKSEILSDSSRKGEVISSSSRKCEVISAFSSKVGRDRSKQLAGGSFQVEEITKTKTAFIHTSQSTASTSCSVKNAEKERKPGEVKLSCPSPLKSPQKSLPAVAAEVDSDKDVVTVKKFIMSQFGIAASDDIQSLLSMSLDDNLKKLSQTERTGISQDIVWKIIKHLGLEGFPVVYDRIEPEISSVGNPPFKMCLNEFSNDQLLLELNVFKQCERTLECQQGNCTSKSSKQSDELLQQNAVRQAELMAEKAKLMQQPETTEAEKKHLSEIEAQILEVRKEHEILLKKCVENKLKNSGPSDQPAKNAKGNIFFVSELPEEFKVSLDHFKFDVPKQPLHQSDAKYLKDCLQTVINDIFELSKPEQFGAPFFRVPEILLLEEEKSHLYARGGCFLLLNRQFPRKVFIQLLALKQRIMKSETKKYEDNRHIITERANQLGNYTCWISDMRWKKLRNHLQRYFKCHSYLRNIIGLESLNELKVFNFYMTTLKWHFEQVQRELAYPTVKEYGD